MKKLTLIALMSLVMTACTANCYSGKGNATVLTSKNITDKTVELTVKKDDGNVLTLQRQYDSHVVPGSRVNVSDEYNKQDSDLVSIKRYEFK